MHSALFAVLYVALPEVATALANDREHAPSFLFILGDDIGWADFRYNNGAAASPHINA